MAEARTRLARKGRRDRFLILGALLALVMVRLLFFAGGMSGLDVVLILLSAAIGALLVVLVLLLVLDQRRKKAERRTLPDEWFRNVGAVNPAELAHCGLAPPESVVKIGTFWTSGLVGADVAVAPDGLRIYPNVRGLRAGMAAFNVPWSWVRDAEIVGMASMGGGVMLVVQYTDGREFSVRTTGRAELQEALDRVAA